jgi:guanylate kinase
MSVVAGKVKRRGLMFVLSSPSGAGKTTLADRLLKADPKLRLSVSATTRPPRPGEIDGVDYHFVSEKEFIRMQDAGEFLESAKVFGNYYGTPRAKVFNDLEDGIDYLFDIDWQGAQQLESRALGDVVKVFILPPSREELERRLRARNQDPEDVMQARMAKADAEISHWAEYEYVIVNYELAESEEMLLAILLAEQLRRYRQVGLSDLVRGMIRGE